MKRERLDFLADNPFYTKRFAITWAGAAGRPRSGMWPRNCASIGRRSRRWRSSTCASNCDGPGTPGPKVIGIDEISIGKGHNYRIVVSDLVRGRPIWFGGKDRSEESMDAVLRSGWAAKMQRASAWP